MYHVATPPQAHPEQFELRSDGGEDEDWYSVRMVTAECFDISAGDAVESVGKERDALMDWYEDLSSPMDQVQHGVEDVYHVRAVPLQDGQMVILDSGADISLLPYEMADRGHPTRQLGKAVLEDAQGGRLQTYGRRSAQIEVEGENNELIVIEDDFIVSNVRNPLVSLGRLLHRGWTMCPNAYTPAGVSLVAPDQGCEIPLQFKRNSLAVFAHIRVVNFSDNGDR